MRYSLIVIATIATVGPVAAQNPRVTTTTRTIAVPSIDARATTVTAHANAMAAHATTIAAHSSMASAHASTVRSAVHVNYATSFAAPSFAISALPVHTRIASYHAPSLTIGAASTLPPASWAPQDPADSLWERAREATRNEEHQRAAGLYQQIRTNARFARSAYRAPSYYWEAYTRARIGTTAELRSARTVLEALKRDHPNYEAMAEANRLEASINGQLAQRGDAEAGRATTQAATRATTQQCDETQQAALEALMHMDADVAMPILRRVMQRRDCDKMRETAVFLISQKRSPEAEDILLEAVRNDPNPKVREAAIFSLSQVPSEKALDALDAIIRSGTDAKLMEVAVFALSQHRSPRATELLRQLVMRQDLSAEVRAHAIFSLGQRPDANAGALLRSLYAQTTDRKLKEAILFALSQRREEANGEFLMQIVMNEREDMEIRKHALFSAGQQGGLSVNRLAELYRTNTNTEMRGQVLFALSQSRHSEAVPQLIEILRIERNTELRKNIIFWLGQSKDPRAIKAIADLIGG